MLCAMIFLAVFGCIEPPPPVEEWPVLVTWYDPALCWEEGMTINCDSVDSAHLLADGLPWDESDYGKVAACPPGWHYLYITLPTGTYLCRDTGPAIDCKFNPYHMEYVCHMDILSRGGIECNYCLLPVLRRSFYES